MNGGAGAATNPDIRGSRASWIGRQPAARVADNALD